MANETVSTKNDQLVFRVVINGRGEPKQSQSSSLASAASSLHKWAVLIVNHFWRCSYSS